MTMPVADHLTGVAVLPGVRLVEALAFGLQWEIYRADVSGRDTTLLRFMPAPLRAQWDVPGQLSGSAARARYSTMGKSLSDSLLRVSSELAKPALQIAGDGALWYAAEASPPFEPLPLVTGRALQAISSVAQSLLRVHRGGAIHGDVHPDFIDLRLGDRCLLGVGTDIRALGADLGINERLGRRGFSPPELWDASGRASLGPWTDIYALGATLYFSLTGQSPPDFRECRRSPDQTKQSIYEAILAAFEPEDMHAERVSDAILWALSPRIGDRPQDVSAWQKALVREPETRSTLLPISTAEEHVSPPALSRTLRRRFLATMSILLLLLGVSYLGYAALPSFGTWIKVITEKSHKQPSSMASKRPASLIATRSAAALPSFDGLWRLSTDLECKEPRAIAINSDSLTIQIGEVTIVEVIVKRDTSTKALITYAPNLDASYEFRPLDGGRELRMTALKQNLSELWIRCG